MHFSHRAGDGLEFNPDSDHGTWLGSGRERGRGLGRGRGRGRGRGHRHVHGNEVEDHKIIFEDPVAPMGFARMKSLLTRTDEEILLELVDPCKGFKEELDSIQTSDGRTAFGLALLLIRRALATTTLPKSLAQLMVMVRGTEWLTQLPIFVQNIRAFNRENIEYLENMLHIFKLFLTKMPSSHDLVNQVLLTLKYLDKVRDIPPSIKHDLDAQVADLQQCANEIEKQNEKQNMVDTYTEEDFLKPPDDFLEISVLPSQDDLVKEEKPFLRMNKCKGQYQGLAHYLDVQFRLLRADFVGPLQNGIQSFLHSRDQELLQGGSTQDIRIYENVRMIGPVCHRNGVAYKIQFNTTRLTNVRWETSKRFLFGSLVCLSADNFQSVFLGIVANRDANDLSKGMVDIYIEGSCEAFRQLDYSDSLVMIESMAFFEAYRPVLLGLKALLDSGIAMSSYIIECDMEPKPPKYLQDNTMCYDMRCLIANGMNSSQWSQVPVLQRGMWPSADDIGLDNSQYKALQTALTQEFALIQGPPGTGKTFIGLKIAEVLLNNSHDVLGFHEKPVMVVCYTNHALDQFLEGIHKFKPDGILRIGGRCKSKILKDCKLHNVRMTCMGLNSVKNDFRDAVGDLRAEMEKCEDGIVGCTAMIEQLNKRIMYTHLLSEFISAHHMEQITSIPVQHKYAVMEWLGQGVNMPFEAPLEKEQVQQNVKEFVDEEEVEVINTMWQLDIEDTNYDTKASAEIKVRVEKRVLRHLGVKHDDPDDTLNSADGWQMSTDEKKHRKKVLCQRLANARAMSEEEANAITDVRQLPVNDRWRLYHFWLKEFRSRLREKTQHMATVYHNAAQRLQEIYGQTDLAVMKRMKVIGMTTTGAATYQHIIQQLAPPIVIIEEAAEVLEAHVITALNPDCKHLILIGDHKQLRPSPAVYELACRYHLDLSLFERMINNGLDCVMLSTQHRMRPEISLLVKPIYPDLKNDDSVLNYPVVRGATHNLFLIDHQQCEDHSEELVSKMNYHEAKYIRRLCLYLLKQGYEPAQITVLTPYSGQMFLIKSEMSKDTFSGIRICVVDSYQGEENDIVLLSLVRSNKEGKLGFLGVENRICVALSRAKLGFYIIGDFMMFGRNKIWKNILKLVCEHRGPGLPLYCPNHPQNKGIYAVTDKDFDHVPEGGCKLPCEYRLPCGHTCPLFCHGYDREHRNIKCTKPCTTIFDPCHHKCQKLCNHDCGECPVYVTKHVPGCTNSPQHEISVACSEDLAGVPCEAACLKFLECKHRCPNLCFEKCGDCQAKVKKSITQCKNVPKHKIWVACSKDVSNDTCRAPCDYVLSCGDICEGDCSKCLQGRVHVGCKQLCRQTLVCNHTCRTFCGVCPQCPRECETRCEHRKCHERCGVPCTPCTEPCAWVCEHYQCTQPCHAPCNRPRCDKRCTKILKCGHQCVGVCGEKCPPLCRNCNRGKLCTNYFGTEALQNALFVYLEDCGHVIEVTAMDRWVDGIHRNGKEMSLQPIMCPLCKLTISQNLRYGKTVNAWCSDVQVVKQKVQEEHDKLLRKIQEISLKSSTINYLAAGSRWQYLLKVIKNSSGGQDFRSLSSICSFLAGGKSFSNKSVSNTECADLLTVLNSLNSIMGLKDKVHLKLGDSTYGRTIVHQLQSLSSWLNNYSDRFHSEVTRQLDVEWQRLNFFIKVG